MEAQSRFGWNLVPVQSASRATLLSALIALFLICFGGGSAQADDPVEPALTDPQAAEELPHEDLNREQAIELLNAVFQVQVQSSAGIYDDLNISRFVSDFAGVIPAGEQPEQTGLVTDGDPGHGNYQGNTLFESSMPIRVEDNTGDVGPIDLGLQAWGSDLVPENPLVEVEIPNNLADGIDLPGAGVTIHVDGAPTERSPSVVEESVAFYPNVAADSDFSAGPTSRGVETMTQLRSPDAPTTQQFTLDMPADASLIESDEGAQVVASNSVLMTIHEPTALDAEGNDVPVEMTIDGSTVTISAHPSTQAAYPILIDPLWDAFHWGSENTTAGLASWISVENGNGIHTSTTTFCPIPTVCSGFLFGSKPGLFTYTDPDTSLASGSFSKFVYLVPRYTKDFTDFGVRPQSFITEMILWNVIYAQNRAAEVPQVTGPELITGIWDITAKNWASPGSVMTNNVGLESPATVYTIPGNNNVEAKQAIFQLNASSTIKPKYRREAYLGDAGISIGDNGRPTVGSLTYPSGWIDTTAPAITMATGDAGVGVWGVEIMNSVAPPATKWWIQNTGSCTGLPSNPCPREWSGTAKYVPAELPTGINQMYGYAVDAMKAKDNEIALPACTCVSNPYEFKLKVDHTPPVVAVSGTAMEQGTLGTSLPSYKLKVDATDGTEATKQSGVASSIIKIDGVTKDEYKPGCATQNCSTSRSLTIKNLDYTVGKHTISVYTKDGVNRETLTTKYFEITRDTAKPAVTAFTGSLVEGPEMWRNEASYSVSSYALEYPLTGFGVTKMELLIDGKLIGSPKTQSCENGACGMEGTFAVNLVGYSGGDHTVAIKATDGAGNWNITEKVIHVNPAGATTNAEVAATMKSAEKTGETTTVMLSSEAIEEHERHDGNDPGLKVEGSTLTTTGVPVETTLAAKPSEGFVLHAPESNVTVVPKAVAEGASSATVTNQVAAVSGNVASGVDLVRRPVYNGLQTFQDIREATSSETYSWTVSLPPGGKLEQVEPWNIEMYDSAGVPVLMIDAEKAHDATGAEVPTTLSISEGNVITLKVEHKGKGFIYPIIGGPSWQVGSKEVTSWTPPPPPPTNELLAMEVVKGSPPSYIQSSAPVLVKGDFDGEGAGASKYKPVYREHFEGYQCSRAGVSLIFNVSLGGCEWWKLNLNGYFFYNHYFSWWKNTNLPTCPRTTNINISIEMEQCGFVGPNHQAYGHAYHITARAIFFVTVDLTVAHQTSENAFVVHMYGSGHWAQHEGSCICNPSPY